MKVRIGERIRAAFEAPQRSWIRDQNQGRETHLRLDDEWAGATCLVSEKLTRRLGRDFGPASAAVSSGIYEFNHCLRARTRARIACEWPGLAWPLTWDDTHWGSRLSSRCRRIPPFPLRRASCCDDVGSSGGDTLVSEKEGRGVQAVECR